MLELYSEFLNSQQLIGKHSRLLFLTGVREEFAAFPGVANDIAPEKRSPGREGVAAHCIWAPCARRIEREDETTGEWVTAPTLSGFRLVHLFAVTDTEGEPLLENPAQATQLTGEAPDGMWTHLTSLIDSVGFDLGLVDEIAGKPAVNEVTAYLAITDQVASSGRSNEQVRTLCHEPARAKQHGPSTPSRSRDLCEVEAESVACLVCHAPQADRLSSWVVILPVSRSFSRWMSPLRLITSAWWTRRSTMAAAITGSAKTPPAGEGLVQVTVTLVARRGRRSVRSRRWRRRRRRCC